MWLKIYTKFHNSLLYLNIDNIYLIIYIVKHFYDKKYIGQSVNITTRWWYHKDKNTDPNSPITRAIIKYGVENFKFEILIFVDNIDDMNRYEIVCIKKYNTLVVNGNGYNIKEGGKNCPHAESTKIKIGKANKGRFKNIPWSDRYGEERSKEIKEKMANTRSQRTYINHMSGKTHSEKTKKHISQSTKIAFKVMKNENPEKWATMNKNKSDSVKKAWKEGRKTNKNMKGHIRSDEHCANLQKSAQKFYNNMTLSEQLKRKCIKLRKEKQILKNKSNDEIIIIFQNILFGNNEYNFTKNVINKLKNGTHWSMAYFKLVNHSV